MADDPKQQKERNSGTTKVPDRARTLAECRRAALPTARQCSASSLFLGARDVTPETAPHDGDEHAHRVTSLPEARPRCRSEEVQRVHLRLPQPSPVHGLPEQRFHPCEALEVLALHVADVGSQRDTSSRSSLVFQIRRSSKSLHWGCRIDSDRVPAACRFVRPPGEVQLEVGAVPVQLPLGRALVAGDEPCRDERRARRLHRSQAHSLEYARVGARP